MARLYSVSRPAVSPTFVGKPGRDWPKRQTDHAPLLCLVLQNHPGRKVPPECGADAAPAACGTATAKPLVVRTARHRHLTSGWHAESLRRQDIWDWEGRSESVNSSGERMCRWTLS